MVATWSRVRVTWFTTTTPLERKRNGADVRDALGGLWKILWDDVEKAQQEKSCGNLCGDKKNSSDQECVLPGPARPKLARWQETQVALLRPGIQELTAGRNFIKTLRGLATFSSPSSCGSLALSGPPIWTSRCRL
jgi:hypothetical protein